MILTKFLSGAGVRTFLFGVSSKFFFKPTASFWACRGNKGKPFLGMDEPKGETTMPRLKVTIEIIPQETPEQELMIFFVSALQSYLKAKSSGFGYQAYHRIHIHQILESITMLHLYCLMDCFPTIDLNQPEHANLLESVVAKAISDIYSSLEFKFGEVQSELCV